MTNAAETLEQSNSGDAPALAAAVELPEPKKPAKPTNFAFEHAVFSVKDAYFSLSPVSGDPVYNVPLGDVRATLVGSSRVDLQACKLEYSIVSPK